MQKELHAPKEKPPAPSVEATREFHQDVVTDTQKYAQAQNEIARKEARQERASKQWNRERSLFAKAVGFFSMEDHLFRKRIKLQEQKKAELEGAWGEGNVTAVIYHSHTSGSKEAGYDGSPDGIFSLDPARPKMGESPRLKTLLTKMGVDAIYLTDHDVSDFDEMNQAIDSLNSRKRGTRFFGGTEITSKEGHFIVMEGPSGKPVTGVPPAKTPAIEIAKWAFDNGYDIMIPHPNPSRTEAKRVAAWLFGLDISVEKETAEEILKLADKYNRLVYIAKSNGTTNEDYKKCLMSGTREPWYAFWKRRMVKQETKDLYLRRAVWIDESDGHIQCEYPSGIVYFRKDKITGTDGKISQEKLSEAVKAQKEIEIDSVKSWNAPEDKDCVMVSYNADKDFNVLDRAAEIPYYIWEYGRLLAVWTYAVFSGKAKQFAPEEKYTYKPLKNSTLKSQYEKMAEFEE